MRFYNQPHQFYCGIDLHARTLYLCILDAAGKKVLHKEVPSEPAALLEASAPFRTELVVAAECMFAWYWVADLCAREQIAFVLGHALYMKAIHGGKAKNDRIDSEKIANLLRGGNLPQAYVYPAGLRETRDLLRRRMFLVHQRGKLITHVQTTNAQYNLPPFGQKLIYAKNRKALKIAERFEDASVKKSMEVNLALVDRYEELIADLELHLERTGHKRQHQRNEKQGDGVAAVPKAGRSTVSFWLWDRGHNQGFISAMLRSPGVHRPATV